MANDAQNPQGGRGGDNGGNGSNRGNGQGRIRNTILYSALAASLAGNAWEIYRHNLRGAPAQVEQPSETPGPQPLTGPQPPPVPEAPQKPQAPAPRYQDMRYKVVSGDDITHIVLDQYSGARTIVGVARNNLELNPGLSLDSRLEQGTVVHLSFNAGVDSPRRKVDLPARAGETYRNIVQRAVDDLVEQVFTRNNLTSDVYTTMPYGQVKKIGLEDKMYAVGGVKTLAEVNDNTPILLKQPDGVKGDIIKPRDELVLPGIRVPEGAAPTSRTYDRTQYFNRLKVDRSARHETERSGSPHARQAYQDLLERYTPDHLRDTAPRIPLSR